MNANQIHQTRRIGDTTVTVTAYAVPSRFGLLWRATNNYGEPRMTERWYRTSQEALAAEWAETAAMLS